MTMMMMAMMGGGGGGGNMFGGAPAYRGGRGSRGRGDSYQTFRGRGRGGRGRGTPRGKDSNSTTPSHQI